MPTITPGAGVTERREDWTFKSLLQDFASDKKLSRAKRAWLNDEYDRIQLTSATPALAETLWCDELYLPQAVYLVQLIAHVLDQQKPRKEGFDRLTEISKELYTLGHLSYEEFDALNR